MSERELKARAFPKGADWFWLLWGLTALALDTYAGVMWLGIVNLILCVGIMFMRRALRVWDAQNRDAADKVKIVMNNHLIKGDEDGRNSGGR